MTMKPYTAIDSISLHSAAELQRMRSGSGITAVTYRQRRCPGNSRSRLWW